MAERQVKAQRKQLRQAEDDLSATRGQIKVLTKKLEEVKKAKEQAEQEGYDMGVIETEKAFRAEVTQVCRFYCLQVWNEALNQAGVEASSALRKAENVYYTPAIRTSGSLSFKANLVSSKADEGQASPSKAPLAPNTSPKEAEQAEDIAKLGDINKEVVQGAALPLVAPKDPSKEKKASQSMELVLAILPITLKEDPKGKTQVSTMAAST
nr:uncharacterized protein LOC112011826 [Quercus suber]